MDVEAKLLTALEKNELIKFLEGKDNYKIELHQWVSANVPTDVSQILSNGIYKVYIHKPEIKIDKLLEGSLLKMMDDGIIGLYIALMIIFDQLQEESYGNAPFKINMNKILGNLKISLHKNEDNLKKCFEWQGKNNKYGLWDEVLRLNRICKEEWNLSII